MAKVFTSVPGLELRVGAYGVATNALPVEVPDDVAAELAGHPKLRIEPSTPAARSGRKAGEGTSGKVKEG